MKRKFFVLLLVAEMLLLLGQVYPVSSEASENRGLLLSETDLAERVEYASSKAQSQVFDFMNRDWNEIQCLPQPPRNAPSTSQAETPRESPSIPPNTNITQVENSVILFDKYQSRHSSQPMDPSLTVSLPCVSDSEGILASNPSYYPYEETYSFPAPIMSPTKDGNWFPKQSYSVLAFEYNNPGFCYAEFWIDVARDQDIYARYLTVYHDGSIILHVVVGSGGYHGAVALGWVGGGNHKLEVQINYCGWKDHQWKLTYAQPFIAHFSGEREPFYDFWEYFPSGSNPTLEWKVQAGFDSYIHLQTQVVSGSQHSISIYINGALRASVESGHSDVLILQPFSADEPVVVKLILSTGSEEYYGTKIKYFTISHNVVTLEIDWMGLSNGSPLLSFDQLFTMAEYVRSYYILHGYARCDWIVGDCILHNTYLSPAEFEYYRGIYYNHAGNDMYEWVLIAEYGDGGYSDADGWHYETDIDYGIAIFASHCGTLNYRRMVLLHEFGHHAGIVELTNSGGEQYCSNPGCCMAYSSDSNAVPAPWYCIRNWSMRNYPYTPQG